MNETTQAPDSQGIDRRHENRSMRLLRRALEGALLVAAIAGIAGTAVLYQQLKSVRSALQAKIELQAKDLLTSHKQLDEVRRASTDLQGRLTALNGRCNTSDAQFKSTIDAFAKQASACEVLRQKLHVAGYPS